MKLFLGCGIAGGIGLLLGVFALLASSLSAVSDHADAIDTRRSSEAVTAALHTSANDMADIVREDTIWDDAVARVYRPQVDSQWLYANLGALTKDNANYDGAYVVTSDGAVLWGYANGRLAPAATIAEFGGAFAPLFAGYKATNATRPASGLVRTASGLEVIAVGLIRPSSSKVKTPEGPGRYLIMTHAIDRGVLDTYSQTFQIDEVRLHPAGAALTRPHIAVRDAAGHIVGQLSWKPALPGIEAARAAWPQIRNSMVLIGLLVLGFVAATLWGVRRLSASEQRARSSARTDELSGLPNRLALMERLQRFRGRAARAPWAMAMLDLDGFKAINDTYGHETGDRLIAVVATRLRAISPKDALLARLGGDQFALLVTTAGATDIVTDFAAAAQKQLAEPIACGAHTLSVGASLGLATAQAGDRADDLIRHADIAMSAAKADGKGGVRTYSDDLDAEKRRRQTLEAEICAGLDRGEFDVHYQPIVDATSHATVAVEALVRWPRRPGGPIGPDTFISAAESSGLIHRLGLFVLDRACRDLMPFDGLRLSVNLSPAQFHDVELETKIAAILADTGFPARRLELEITEGYLIGHPARATAAIAALKAMGLSVSLDDFGTGYTSIAYLQSYGFSRNKIDRSLAGAVDDGKSKAGVLVAGSVFLANGLDMAVTAEGVETEAQATLLRAAGCKCLQGYFFGRPAPVATLAERMTGEGAARAAAL